jgi:hypothetical protein
VNKRYIGPIVYVALVSLTATMAFSFSIAPRYVSWIETVENFIREEWKSNATYWGLEDGFFLHEHGKEQFFALLSSQREFISYMKGLTSKINKQLNSSVSKEYVDEILATDKVLQFVHRFPEGFGLFGLYGSSEVAYFILEDKLGKNIEGTIIMRDRCVEYSHYSVWQITDWGLW